MTNLERIQVFSQQKYKKNRHPDLLRPLLLLPLLPSCLGFHFAVAPLAHMWNRRRRTKRPSGRDTCSLSSSALCRGTFKGRHRSLFSSQNSIPLASTATFSRLQPICLFSNVEKVQMHRVIIFKAYDSQI